MHNDIIKVLLQTSNFPFPTSDFYYLYYFYIIKFLSEIKETWTPFLRAKQMNK